MSRVVKCSICGNIFTTDKPRGKYCSEKCRKKGEYNTRVIWRKKTNYGVKQRNLLREKRALEHERITGILRADLEQKRLLDEIRYKEQLEKKEKELIARADEGDPEANMTLSLREGGLFNPRYWYWYKISEIQYCENLGKISKRTVDGHSVYDEGFEDKVVNSIKEDGRVYSSL